MAMIMCVQIILYLGVILVKPPFLSSSAIAHFLKARFLLKGTQLVDYNDWNYYSQGEITPHFSPHI